MRVLFLDPGARSYHVDTPAREPLGGTESAICYLAVELARAGVDVVLANGDTPEQMIGSVRRVPAREVAVGLLAECDVIALNATAPLLPLREVFPDMAIVLWSGREDDQPQVAALADPAVRSAVDAFVFVSQWQAAQYSKRFGIDPARTRVFRNGVAPAMRPSNGARPLRCAYTSAPYRGLSALLDAWPRVRGAIPEAMLHVFSDMRPHGGAEGAYASLYARARGLEGVVYRGSIPQPELAYELRAARVLAYPGLWPETSCIAVLEALASGCRVVTSTCGALPETCAGFATLVEPGEGFVDRYAAAVIAALREDRAAPDAVWHVQAHHGWSHLALAWRDWLIQLAHASRAACVQAPAVQSSAGGIDAQGV